LKLKQDSGDSAAIGADGTLYFTGGSLFAFTPDGANLWAGSADTSIELSSPSIGPDGTIYVTTGEGRLCAFSPSGELKWQAHTNGLSRTTPAIDSAGTVYFLANSALFAISPAGGVLWGYALLTDPRGIFNQSYTSPTISPDGTIYVTSYNRLYAFAGTNGLADSPWPMYRQNPRHTGKIERPALKQPQKRADAGFEFQLYPNELGRTYTIESSTNLDTWTSLTSFVATTLPTPVVDLDASNSPARFYRAFSP
jgi:hypothetical protein